jgi:hypothetical protein
VRAPGRFVAVRSVTLDSTGSGSVTVAPSGTDWLVLLTTVSVATATKKPVADLTLNNEATPYESTLSGDRDVSDTRHLVMAGDTITATWTGGDPGAVATLRVTGIQAEAGRGVGLLGG